MTPNFWTAKFFYFASFCTLLVKATTPFFYPIILLANSTDDFRKLENPLEKGIRLFKKESVTVTI